MSVCLNGCVLHDIRCNGCCSCDVETFACCRCSCRIFWNVREAGTLYRTGWMFLVVVKSNESRYMLQFFGDCRSYFVLSFNLYCT